MEIKSSSGCVVSTSSSADPGRALIRLSLAPGIEGAVSWCDRAAQVFLRAKAEQRRVSRETLDAVLASRPPQDP